MASLPIINPKKDVMMPKSAHLYSSGARSLWLTLMLLFGSFWSAQLQAMTEPEALAVLTGRDFSAKEQAFISLANSHQPYVQRLFDALEQGDLRPELAGVFRLAVAPFDESG